MFVREDTEPLNIKKRTLASLEWQFVSKKIRFERQKVKLKKDQKVFSTRNCARTLSSLFQIKRKLFLKKYLINCISYVIEKI